MGRKKSQEGSSYSYLKQLLLDNQDLLWGKKNADILARYRADHKMAPDAEVEKKVMNNLANLKSVLRKATRKRRRAAAKQAGVKAPKPGTKLEALEERIDDCLTMARHLDAEGLQDVIQNLRRARNAVVWKQGEK